MYRQQSARYLEHWEKYSSVQLQCPYYCNNQVYIIYDLKITKKHITFYQFKKYLFIRNSLHFLVNEDIILYF